MKSHETGPAFLIRRRLGPILGAVIASFLYANSAFAFDWVPRKADWDVLPPYCKAKMSSYPFYHHPPLIDISFPPAETEKWKRAMGNLWLHMHHYCAGVAWLAAAKGRIPHSYPKALLWSKAAGEMHYTWYRADRSHPFYMQMSADLIEANQGAGKREIAIGMMGRLMAERPTDLRSYVIASNFYARDGALDQAIDMLKLGEDQVTEKGTLQYLVAKLYLKKGENESARDYARLARSAGISTNWISTKLENAGFPLDD